MRILVLCLLVLAACKPPEKEIASNIINIDSLLNAQVKILSGYGAEKIVSVADSTFTATKVGISINWENELKAFSELGQVNRPIYSNAYAQSLERDTQSNLMVRTWTAKTKLPVSQIKLYFLPEQNRLKRLEASIHIKDFYFAADRKLVLDFSLLGDSNQLESYHISGSQKYFWSVAQNFSVNSMVKP